MTDFENVGFCNTVEGIKYLICADCEIGPLGYHDTHSAAGGQPLFHIAVSRVRTRDTDPLPGQALIVINKNADDLVVLSLFGRSSVTVWEIRINNDVHVVSNSNHQ